MRNHWKVLVFVVVAVLAVSIDMFSQDRVPVTQDGKPVVMARNPAPHTADGRPDLSGVWAVPSSDEAKILTERFGPNPIALPAMTPWAEERYLYNRDTRPGHPLEGYPGDGQYSSRPELNPFIKCLPPGTSYLLTGWGSISPSEIIQSPKRILMIYEYDHTIRQIWMDGRKHPDPVDPTWVGHSIGTWEGDTLVVDTVGLKNKVWLDGAGHVFGPDLHIIERYRRPDNDTLQLDFTYDDPKAFTKPWTRRQYRRLRPTWELIEDARCYPGSPETAAQEENFDDLNQH
jgi:hypothetical protein